jgi:sialate O-acetylesterase
MIHPIIQYNIAGTIWYQGESNRHNPSTYQESFSLMIETWRKRWKNKMPFYFVQIAPFDYGSKTGLESALVKEAQLHTMLSVNQTGMVVTNDIGELKNIHPINKQDVGKRLALWALAKTYGVKGLSFSGPVYKGMEIVKNKIRISFQYADQGLQIKGKELTDFYISGSDQKFYKAKARIKGNQIEVSSKKVKSPVAVRFAFSDTATPNLYNAEGLPASGFRTDDWEVKF